MQTWVDISLLELRFNLRRTDERNCIYRIIEGRYNEGSEHGQFYGGSVKMWLGISLNTTETPMFPFSQNLNAERYQNHIFV